MTSFSLQLDGDDDEEDDDMEHRPMTPAERSASRASQSVYGTGRDEANEPNPESQKDQDFTVRPITPQSRPPSRLQQVLDDVVYVAEDIMIGSKPNLAKVWGEAYQRELDTDIQHDSPKFMSDDGGYLMCSYRVRFLCF